MSLTLNLPPRPSAAATALRDRPYIVTLGVRPGATPSDKPPVRIFLGTEDQQYRAERVFFYAIERIRDPSRVYEIHVMKNLAGFVRTGWRTGFTNYRFAIPDFAGRHGRAIYNDVDQIYTADPARLFDLDLGGHGYLAVSASDTSVMLLDCARMAEWWNHAAAMSETKDRLLSRVKRVPGIWGAMDGGWNARDMEFVEGQSMLLHYTAMHTQPWHPFPKDYAYRAHPLGEIWYRLERAADAEGYAVFSVDRPSPLFAETLALHRQAPEATASTSTSADAIERLASSLKITSALSLSIGQGGRSAAMEAPGAVRHVNLAAGEALPQQPFDAVIAEDLLEMAPSEDVPWLIEVLFSRAAKLVYIAVKCFPSGEALADGADRRRSLREPAWWRERVSATAARHPGIVWRLDAIDRNRRGRLSTVAYQSTLAGNKVATPKVWVLVGTRAGDRSQLLGLADALGWPYEIKELAYNRLHLLPNWLLGVSAASVSREARASLAPPWPDLVIDGGKRSVPVARWIRDRAGGQARWVHVGRSWAPLEQFDLLVTTPQYRLPPRPNVLHIATSPHRITPQRLASAAQDWKGRLQHLPRPWTALLVGGDSPPYALDAAAAARLGQEANGHARRAGGALLVTTSARTSPAAAEALFNAINVPAHCHRWQRGDTANPYIAYLALADSLIVTGDSASMLSEACATGKPVALFETPRRPTLLSRFLAGVERVLTGHGSRRNYRGMPKQQDWMARSFDRMIERGLFMPIRDLREYHRTLIERGLVYRSGDAPPPKASTSPPAGNDDMRQAVDRIHGLMNGDRRVA